jgi:GT2 family glycosyltransferase
MTARDLPAPAPPEVTAVVPTVGRSPWLTACLQALRRQEGVRSLEIVVVDQSPSPLALPPGLADRVLRPERNLGFAGGTNLGLAAARGALLATVNDDAVVGPGWLAALAAALRDDPRAAAAQGVNLLADDLDLAPSGNGPAPASRPDATRPGRIDGCGLGWNRWWQAIQLGHGEPAPALDLPPAAPRQPPPDLSDSAPGSPASGAARAGGTLAPDGATARGAQAASGRHAAPVEVFGVSATAALFRRAALEQVALGAGGQVFDPRLVSYYEDAELAGRLRAAGFSALLVPAARARHAGSASGRTAPATRDRWRLVYGNRYLAAARLLGRGLWPRLPLMLLRDLLDAAGPAALLGPLRARWRHPSPGKGGGSPGHRRLRLAGMAAGWGRAARHLPAYARRGAPAPAPAEIARLSRWPAQPR